ncbi:hypothetical protein AYI70_g8642 [Smittium culicis]|uniref:Uncharacterized protein n=1 Tax=Smittium culicis TaxID=133412 RepID=A0A1R1XF05_9FUNG|nr:hypothetical protein AYI70_g8642 [Smittium culicis]
MEPSDNNFHSKQGPSWANVVKLRDKPPDTAKKSENKFVPVSLFKSTTGSEPAKRKIACLGGTTLKLGISLRDIYQDTDEFVEEILIQFGEIQTCFEIDNRRKLLFLKFANKIDFEKAKKIELIYKEKKVEVFETTEYSEDFKTITIPSYNGLSVWEVAQKAHEELSKLGEVIDITALKYKQINSFPSKSIKINFKTNKDCDIPSSLMVMEIKVLLLWKGGEPICTYCKKSDHWKYQCEDLKNKIEKKTKRTRTSTTKNSKKVFIKEVNQIVNTDNKIASTSELVNSENTDNRTVLPLEDSSGSKCNSSELKLEPKTELISSEKNLGMVKNNFIKNIEKQLPSVIDFSDSDDVTISRRDKYSIPNLRSFSKYNTNDSSIRSTFNKIQKIKKINLKNKPKNVEIKTNGILTELVEAAAKNIKPKESKAIKNILMIDNKSENNISTEVEMEIN